ncbi:MAG: protease HtpX [Deltaproteobacteria bacterium RIFCSPLOWO2_02_FULL_53_8]|nr:MAG: protease HtpX [Deltaproteobacteria bacterium RIFCSPLOWO2_02_FULL_53_8]
MNYVKTAMLLAALTAMLVIFGDLFGGRGGAIIALGLAGIMNFVMYWWSDSIVLRMYSAKEATAAEAPALHAAVRGLVLSANMPMPKVYIMDSETPNAFATGRNPSHAAVAVTTGIMNLLTTDELRGVLAHELAHIKNRDILIATVAATIAGAIGYLSHMAYFASLFGGSRDDDEGGSNPIVAIVMMIVAPLAAAVIQMAISRSREYGADEGGAAIAGNPRSLANALRKLDFYNRKAPMEEVNQATAHMFIVSPLSGGSMLRLFSTHPPIEERIKKLEAMAMAGR